MSGQDKRSYGTNDVSDPYETDKKHDYWSDEQYLSDASSDDPRATQGVKAIEAISRAWSGGWLIVAYVGVLLLANIVSLEQQTTFLLANYAQAEFGAGSLISTITVVSTIFLSTVKPIMAKLSDVTGRLEAFSIAIFLYVVGYIQQAASQNTETLAAAQLFYAAGSTGIQILIQIFVADTSDLLWRAFFSSLPDLPYIWTVWVGSEILGSLTAPGGPGWRWGYAVWTIVLPISFIPLFIALFVNLRKAKQMGIYPRSPYRGKPFMEILKTLWYDLDFFGLLLLTALIALILVPLTIGPTAGWSNPSVIAMFCVGGVCLLVFPFWEMSKKLAPKAFFPRDIFRNRTALLGFAIGFFYFMAFALANSAYFYTYLVVVESQGDTSASNIQKIFSFASSITSVLLGLVIYFTAHYKYFITAGGCLYVIGFGLLIAFRYQGASVSALIGTQIAVGVGGGMINVPAQLGVQASVNHQQVAAATAIFLTIFEIGGAVGAAIAGATWGSLALPKLRAYLPPETAGQALALYNDYTTVIADYPVGTPTRDAINRAYQESINVLNIIAICVAGIIIFLSLGMKNYKLDTIDQKVKGRVIGGKTSTTGDSEADKPSEGMAELATTHDNTSRWTWLKARRH